MHFSSTVAICCSLLQARPGSARPSKPCSGGSQAVYVITNEDRNMVVSLPVDGNGRLGGGKMVATGGAGAISIDGATNEPAGADPLVSQSALTVIGTVSNLNTALGGPF